MLLLPGAGQEEAHRVALMDAVIKKVSELSGALVKLTGTPKFPVVGKPTSGRASFVEHFVVLLDRLAAGCFDDYHVAVSKVTLDQKKHQAVMDQMKAHSDQEKQRTEDFHRTLQEQARGYGTPTRVCFTTQHLRGGEV